MPNKPNFAAMTPEQRRDWLSEQEGWKRRGDRWRHPVYHKLGSGQKRHPLPNTLDAAAEAMPEGWSYKIVVHKGNVQATAWPSKLDRMPSHSSPYWKTAVFVEHTSLMDALFRLAAECVWAERERS